MAVTKLLTDLDLRFEDCEFIVEATFCEKFFLWKEWHAAVPWEEDNMGLNTKLGVLDSRPLMLTVFFVKINGHRVAFYESGSQLVDHKLMYDFFEKNFQVSYDGGRWAHCDAMNFSHCIHCVIQEDRDKVVYERMLRIKQMEEKFMRLLEKTNI